MDKNHTARLAAFKAGRKARAQRKAHNLTSPERAAYLAQKRAASKRGIPWEFTFESWVEFWGEDFARRGCSGPDSLCMARLGDTGPYAPWNVEKATLAQNTMEAQAYQRVREMEKSLTPNEIALVLLDSIEAKLDRLLAA
jgi:hypothetical protein